MKFASILFLATVFSSGTEVFAGPLGSIGAPMVSRKEVRFLLVVLWCRPV